MIVLRTSLALAVLLASQGCSSNGRDAPLGHGGGLPGFVGIDATAPHRDASGGDDGGVVEEAAVADSPVEAEAEAAGPCDDVVQAARNVSEYASIFAPPAPMGGTILSGTYILNEVTTTATPDASVPEMPPVMPTGVQVHSTIYATDSMLRIVEARGTPDGDGGFVFPDDSVHAEMYSTSASMLSLTQICPDAGTQSSMPYTATDAGLTLFVSSAEYYGFHLVP